MLPILTKKVIRTITVFITTFCMNASLFAQIETIPTGSFIINMGVTPQTINNGLKPYGLIWDIIKNNNAQVKWVISQTKVKDAKDFTYNLVDYKGGTFIIPQKFITAAVLAKINALFPATISGVYTTSSLTVDVTYTLKYTPRWTFDLLNGTLAQAYLTNAGIPLTSFPKKSPQALNGCDDLFAMPHADPTWATHSNLYGWNSPGDQSLAGLGGRGGWIWSACHATSVMENLVNPLNAAQQMNFLTTDGMLCYDVTKCGPAPSHLKLQTMPITYSSIMATDPMGQFMDSMHTATYNGSEMWYQPKLTGGWRATTKILANTSDGTSPRQGVVLAYGRAFGDPTKGMVMYEGGHDHNKGTGTAGNLVKNDVAAQRAFLNFSFLSTTALDPKPSPTCPASALTSGTPYNYSVTVLAGYTLSDYNVQWSSSCGGSFTNSGIGISTIFSPPSVALTTNCTITVTLIDGCGRRFYETCDITINPAPPVALDRITESINNPAGTGPVAVGAVTPLAGTDPDGTVVSFTITSLPPAVQGVISITCPPTPIGATCTGGFADLTAAVLAANPAGIVLTPSQAATFRFDPADSFGGNATFNYTVTDNLGLIDATPATYTIPVNPPPVAQDILTNPINSNSGATLIAPPLNATDNGTIVNYIISTVPPASQGILYLNGVPLTVGQVLTPAQAAQISFDPSGTYVGYVTFTYTATDNNGVVDPTPATVTIQVVNQPPVAQDITSSSIANPNGTGQTAIPSLTGTDSDGTIVSYTITSVPPVTEGVLYYFNGTSYVEVMGGQVLTPAQAASLKFDPADGFTGNSTFTYSTTDNNGLVDNTPATYNIPVGIVPPVATNITNAPIYSGAGQTAINPLSGIDPDATNIITSYIVTSLPLASQGVLFYFDGASYVPIVAGNPLTPVQMASLRFDPTDGATGNVIFNYTVRDDETLIDLSSATYTIPLINTPPVAINVTNPAVNSTDGPIGINPLSATDADGIVVSYTITSLPNPAQGVLLLSGVPVTVGQVLTPAQIALLQFDPAPGSTGTATFNFTAKDDQGATDATPATFSIPINNINLPPVADDKFNTSIPVNAGATSILSLTGADPDGTIATFTITTIPPSAQGILYLNGVPVTAGQVIPTYLASQLTFDPSGTYVGNVVFNYTTSDNYGLVDATPAAFTIPITNQPPIANDITIPQIATGTTEQLAPLSGKDVDGTIAIFTISTLPTLGTLQVDLDGPGPGGYTNVTAGQVLTPAQAASLQIIAGASTGVSTFTYTTTDNNGAVDATPATYTIPIGATAAGQPPIADDKLNTAINANAGVTATLSLTATDPDGTIASYTILSVPAPATGTLYYLLGGVTLTAITDGGLILTLAEALTIRFDPSGNYIGDVTFRYTATDNVGNVDPTPATYIIPIINTPPVATNVTNASMGSNVGPTTISSLTATDADGTVANYTITSLPTAAQGVLYLDGVPVLQGQVFTPTEAARLKFDPNPLFSGNATFTFTATDNLGAVDQTPATFTIPVTNQPPIADNKLSQIITNNIGTSALPIPNLSGSDVDGTIASYTIKTLPTNGTLYINGVAILSLPGAGLVITLAEATQLSFDPNDGFSGTSSFTYTTTDNSGLVDATAATYQIPVNTPPTTNNITSQAFYDAGVNAAIPAFIGADDGSVQFYTISSLPPLSQGSLYLNGVLVTSLSQVDTLSALQITQLSFTPAAGFTGTTFTYTATDNLGVIDVTPAVYTIPQKISISGSVWNDANGGLSQDGTETIINGTNAGGGVTTGAIIYVNLIDATGIVIATAPVQSNGTYTFPDVPTNATVTVQLTTTQGTVGLAKPATTLPAGWVTTGENKNGKGGLPDATPNSEIVINTNNSSIAVQNLGLERLPNTISINFVIPTPSLGQSIILNGGSNPPILSGIDPEDQPVSGVLSGKSIQISTVPVNSELYFNGIIVTSGQIIPNFNANLFAIKFTASSIGSIGTSFTYAYVDAAGKVDPTPATYLLTWAGVLPVKIVSFTAVPKGSQVNLEWVVSEQTNVATYEVEFNSNGRNFDKIATVASNGNQGATYDAVHSTPIAGINYYRIKTIEKDGTISYSEIRKVNFGKGGEISIYPNPVSTGEVYITLTGSMIGKAATVSIISMDGKLISQQKIASTSQTQTLDVSRLASGSYVVRIVTDIEVINKMIEVIR
jgi:Secretion system C-terminal sorting domain/Bacterial Ig domain